MADKKITQFENFTGVGDDHTYFVIASGENAEPNTTNYRVDFVNLSHQVGNILFDGPPPISGNSECLHFGIFDTGDHRCINIDASGDSKISIRPDFGTYFEQDLYVSGVLYSENHIQGITCHLDYAKITDLDAEDIWSDKVVIGNGPMPNDMSNSDGESFRLSVQAGANNTPGGIYVSSQTRAAIDTVPLIQADSSLGGWNPNAPCFTVTPQGKTAIGHGDPKVVLDVEGAPSTRGDNNEILKLTAKIDGRDSYLGFGIDALNDVAWIHGYRQGTTTDIVLQNEDSDHGFVGIGEQNPAAKLHVSGPAIFEGDLSVKDDIYDTSLNRFVKENEIGNGTLTVEDQDGNTLGTFTANQQGNTLITVANAPLIDPNGGIEDGVNGLRIIDYGEGWSDGALFISDSKFKSLISKIESPLSIIESINGVRFKWNDLSKESVRGQNDVGFIAQEVQEVLPEAVSKNSDSELSVYYHKIIPVLLESIKEQQKEINLLKKRVSDLEKE